MLTMMQGTDGLMLDVSDDPNDGMDPETFKVFFVVAFMGNFSVIIILVTVYIKVHFYSLMFSLVCKINLSNFVS